MFMASTVEVKPVKLGNNERMTFSKISEVIKMPNLIEIQKDSYEWFLNTGLKEVFRDMSSITDYTGNLVLNFISYRLDDKPKYTVKECKERDTTYAAPLRVRAQLLNKETGEIKENEVFMGDFPLMTESGTFVINGAERVVVSQLVRSPGVYYDLEIDKAGKKLYNTTVIPNRGAWLEYGTEQSDSYIVRIDKNRKLLITTFIRALDFACQKYNLGISTKTNEDIINIFGEDYHLLTTLSKDTILDVDDALIEIYRKLRPGEPATVEGAMSHLNNLLFD